MKWSRSRQIENGGFGGVVSQSRTPTPPTPTPPTPSPPIPSLPTPTTLLQPPDLHLFLIRRPHYTCFASNRLRVKFSSRQVVFASSCSRQVCSRQIVRVKLSCSARGAPGLSPLRNCVSNCLPIPINFRIRFPSILNGCRARAVDLGGPNVY